MKFDTYFGRAADEHEKDVTAIGERSEDRGDWDYDEQQQAESEGWDG